MHNMLSLDKALLINTPFNGSYYPAMPERARSPPTNWGWSSHLHAHGRHEQQQQQQVALAVFARLDPEHNAIWLVAREIHTAATEEGRRSELTWTSLENWHMLEKVLKKPGFQIFVPKKKFTVEGETEGVLDVEKIKRAWLDMIVVGEESARIEGLRVGVERMELRRQGGVA
jgi:hypothetical protein